MKKAAFLLCTVALLVAPSAFACQTCGDDGLCAFGGLALQCYQDFQDPNGPPTCFTTGHCGPIAQPAALASELTLASVEIRQGDTVVAQTVAPAPARNARLTPPPTAALHR
jgi:hypothetical protein